MKLPSLPEGLSFLNSPKKGESSGFSHTKKEGMVKRGALKRVDHAYFHPN